MAKFTWQDGTLVSKAKVEIGGTIYEVDPEEYSGATPLSAGNLNAMQDGIYEDIDAAQETIDNITVYSTTEKNVGKWIDNKPIYRKTIFVGNLPNNAEKTVAHNISNLNFATRVFGFAYNSEGRTFPLPALSFGLSSGNVTPSIYLFADRNNITLGTGIDRSSYSAYVTIEYTKTTD